MFLEWLLLPLKCLFINIGTSEILLNDIIKKKKKKIQMGGGGFWGLKCEYEKIIFN